VGIWGLAFKPKTDDMREAPSIDVIRELTAAGHTVTAHDPAAMDRAKPLLPDSVTFVDAPIDAARDANALVLLTEWDVFRGIDLKEVKNVMKGSDLFDGRNVYEPEEVKAAGFAYYCVGLPSDR
jgi:UDPglucose 6-dehydrogenase